MAVLPIRSGEPPVRIFRFGPFQLDARTGELRKRGVRVRLPDQSLQVLLMLLERPGDVVLREEIREKLWPDDTIVEFDPSINAAVKKLREALGDSADEPRYVETLARRGYRFLGEVETVGETSSEGAPGPPAPIETAASGHTAFSFRGVLKNPVVAWIAAGVVAVALAALAIIHLRQSPSEAVLRFTVFPTGGTSLENGQPGTNQPQMAVSPDGRRLAFIAVSGTERRIWVRSLDATAAQPLVGTEGATFPFWSPDSRSLGFFANRQLKKIDANGGPVITLCDGAVSGGGPGSWSREGVILFGRPLLLRVPASGGAATPATRLDEGRKEITHRFPWFLPDGRHFLYAASAVPGPGRLTIRAGSLDSLESKVLFEADSNAVYSKGRLLFLRDEHTLMAQPFDPRRLVSVGDVVPAAERVRRQPYNSLGIFSVSENGVLVYQSGTDLGKRQMSWLGRSGKSAGALGDPLAFRTLNLSPDGKQLAVGADDSNITEIWLYDLARGARSRFASGPGHRKNPIWSPDGRTLVYDSDRGGREDLYRKPSDGSGTEELLYADDLNKEPTSWSPDGKFLIYDGLGPEAGGKVWLLPLTPEQPGAPLKPIPLVAGGYGKFSPDGRWVAYQSGESGTQQIHVAAFRGKERLSGKRWQVSTAGGQQPRWRRDGKEIFFVAPASKLMTAEVSFKGDLVEIGKVRELFSILPGVGFEYDVTADGQRFLAAVPSTQPAPEPLTVVVNWTSGLNK
jgi:DNA-binding winged helix-turn-helix (wHTH) protein/dipeptidyl aminopeptidase/acylaminoacyl peptidase